MRRKVTVVGAGNVGATAAQEIARRDYANVVLVDIKENLPQGKALDLNEAGPVLGYEPTIVHVDRHNQPIDALTAELIAAEQAGPAPHRYIEVD